MKSRKIYPSQDELNELFRYCSTGNLYWKQRKSGRRVNIPAGNVMKSGYVQVYINGSNYLLHRLMYIMHYGDFSLDSRNVIDHIDGNSSNNKIENLQQISQKRNVQKQSMKSNNSSGYRGVYYNKNRKKWHAQIMYGRNKVHIGYFVDKDDAAIAYDNAAKKYHGAFARPNFSEKEIAA